MSIFAKDDWEYEEGPEGADRWRNVETDELRYNKPAGAEGPEEAEDSAAEDVLGEEETVNDLEDISAGGIEVPSDEVEMFEGIGGQMLRIGGNDGIRIEGLDEDRLDGDDFEDFDTDTLRAEYLENSTNQSIRIQDAEGNSAFIQPKRSERAEIEEYFDTADTSESLRNPTEDELEVGQTLDSDDGEITVSYIDEETGSLVAENDKIYDFDELYIQEEDHEAPDYTGESPTKDQLEVGQSVETDDGGVVIGLVQDDHIIDEEGEIHDFDELEIAEYRDELGEDNVEVGEELLTENGVRVTVDEVESNAIYTERGVNYKFSDLDDPAKPDLRDKDFAIDVSFDDGDISPTKGDKVHHPDYREPLTIDSYDEDTFTFIAEEVENQAFYYNDKIELTDETRQEKIENIQSDMAKYEYEEDNFSSVAAEKVVRGNVVDEIRSYEWTRNYTDIEDEDLALDALEQVVTDGGSKTAEDKLRSRLRGMGMDTGEINKAIGAGPGPDAGEDVGDVLDEHVPYGMIDQRESVTEERQEFAEDLVTNATTESLEEYYEENQFPVTTEEQVEFFDNKLADIADEDAEVQSLEREVWLAQQQWKKYGDDKEEKVEQFLNRKEEEIKTEFEIAMEGDGVSKMVQAALYYREDSDVVDSPTDAVNIDGVDAIQDEYEHNTKREMDKVEEGLANFFNNVEDDLAVAMMSNLEEVRFQDVPDANGKYMTADKVARVDTNVFRKEDTLVHELAHHVHAQLGFTTDNYPEYDPTKPKNQYDFGTPEGGDGDDGEGFRDALKKLAKNWDRYQNDEVGELRDYQKRAGNEYATVSFRHWCNDETKLKEKDPYQALFWERWAGEADEVIENDDNSLDHEDLEVGDECVVDRGQGAEHVEVKEKMRLNDDEIFIKYSRPLDGTFMLKNDRAINEVEQVAK